MALKTGKAYGFMDYLGREEELIGFMEIVRSRANFPDSLRLRIIDDRLSESHDHKRKGLPQKIAKLAETIELYGSVSSGRLEDLPRTLKGATDLRYLIVAEAPEVSSSSSAEPLGQGRANSETAGMLQEIFSQIGSIEAETGKNKALRAKVFYQDSRRRAQEY